MTTVNRRKTTKRVNRVGVVDRTTRARTDGRTSDTRPVGSLEKWTESIRSRKTVAADRQTAASRARRVRDLTEICRYRFRYRPRGFSVPGVRSTIDRVSAGERSDANVGRRGSGRIVPTRSSAADPFRRGRGPR